MKIFLFLSLPLLLQWTALVSPLAMVPYDIRKAPFICSGYARVRGRTPQGLGTDVKMFFTCVILGDRLVMTQCDVCGNCRRTNDAQVEPKRLFNVTLGLTHLELDLNVPGVQTYTEFEKVAANQIEDLNYNYRAGVCLIKLKGPPTVFNERVQKAVLYPHRSQLHGRFYLYSFGGGRRDIHFEEPMLHFQQILGTRRCEYAVKHIVLTCDPLLCDRYRTQRMMSSAIFTLDRRVAGFLSYQLVMDGCTDQGYMMATHLYEHLNFTLQTMAEWGY